MATIPVGRYRAWCVNDGVGSVRFSKSAQKKTPQVQVDCVVEGQVRTWAGFFTAEAWEMTAKALRAIAPGWKSDRIRDFAAEAEAGRCTGEFEVEIEHEPYKGRVYDRIAFIRPVGLGGVPMEESDLAALDAQMRASLRTVPQTATEVPARRTAPGARRGPLHAPGSSSSNGVRPPVHPDDRDVPPPTDDDTKGWG